MKFTAFERAKQGTGASRRLRNTGRTPGIVYGGVGLPALIELDHNALWHALKKEAFHSTILEMELGDKSGRVLLRDVQMHPFRPQVQHIDFQRVDEQTKLTMKVPARYIPDAVEKLLSTYVAERGDGEKFGAWTGRVGTPRVQELLAEYRIVPEFTKDPMAYVDWGQSKFFTLDDMGEGECAV